MTHRAWRIFAAGAWLLAGACLVAILASYRLRPVLLSEEGRSGAAVGVRLAAGYGYFSWRPRTPYRPDWAGQVARPLWAPLAASCVVGWAARRGAVAAKRRRTLPGTCPD